MAVIVLGSLLLFSILGHSDAAYCLCNSGLNDTVLQKNIDYACGAGADCSAIMLNGACYNPNTVKDHCNYAVNSYYQRKGNIAGSCDFQATAQVSNNPPAVVSGCVYQSSPSSGGSTTPGGTPGGTTTIPGSPGPTTSVFGSTDNRASVREVVSGSSILVMLLSVFLHHCCNF